MTSNIPSLLFALNKPKGMRTQMALNHIKLVLTALRRPPVLPSSLMNLLDDENSFSAASNPVFPSTSNLDFLQAPSLHPIPQKPTSPYSTPSSPRRGNLSVGQAGTLDPIASGVLVVGVGRPATKRLTQFLHGPKCYVVHFRLGVLTDTLDSSGSLTATQPYAHVTRQAMERSLAGFLGETMQQPPMFSALKVGGKRMHELARSGVDLPDRPARAIYIEELELLSFAPPYASIRCKCGSGTYVRSLVVDLAAKLGTVATATDITRVQQGDFHLDDCLEYPWGASQILKHAIQIKDNS